MNKKVKTALKIILGLIVIMLLMHLTVNYLVPFIIKMHSGAAH